VVFATDSANVVRLAILAAEFAVGSTRFKKLNGEMVSGKVPKKAADPNSRTAKPRKSRM
jgi:hypothetical protein